jgi:Transglycosylase SLT domain
MPRARPGRRKPRKTARAPASNWRLPRIGSGRRYAVRILQRAPFFVQGLIVLSAAAILWLALNWMYQVLRKPSELFFPVSGTLNKTPAETWRQYGSLFGKYSTPVVSPELLAALAQVEGSGNPLVRTYWRWSFSPRPFEVYRPASSAVGMFQITDGTFAEARHYCIRDHAVAEDGPWNDWDSCWFNRLYTRVIPSHAIELTAAYLDRGVTGALERHHVKSATPQQRQDLAAVIHLCGAGSGDTFVRRGLKLAPGERCGEHDARDYVSRVSAMERVFENIEASSSAQR